MAPAKKVHPRPQDLIDVVVATSRSSLDFLESWRQFLQPFHLIIVVDGDAKPSVPAGFDYEIYSRNDVNRILGDKAWCITACQSFGVLVSKRPYVYILDEHCAVAKDPKGKEINPLEQHLTNLTSPATPFFFNTLYDPYREGADFVRGYPFSLREGAATAVSHGLWLNVPDYDAATSMVKPLERNSRYVDSVLTVPRNALYSMSGLNLAFNRELIGPAMYFGLNLDGSTSGRVDEIWAGWCSKVVADHLGYGHKTGLPYVWNGGKASTKALASMPKEAKSMQWQEQLVPFFSSVKLSADNNTADKAYLELADKVRQALSPVDPFFSRLADAMVTWVQCWKQLNTAA